MSLTQALLDNAGRFGHVGDQTDCDALLSEHLRRSESVTELELMAMQRAGSWNRESGPYSSYNASIVPASLKRHKGNVFVDDDPLNASTQ